MYLLDTNIWLERLLNQARAAEVKRLLDTLDSSELALSDFALHSEGVILGRTQKLTLLDQFVADLFVHGRTVMFQLSGADVQAVTAPCMGNGLISTTPINTSWPNDTISLSSASIPTSIKPICCARRRRKYSPRWGKRQGEEWVEVPTVDWSDD